MTPPQLLSFRAASRLSHRLSLAPRLLVICVYRLVLVLDYSLDFFDMDRHLKASTSASSTGVPVSSTASATPSASAQPDAVSARSCPGCSRRMSSLKYDRHSFCTKCRPVKCSLDNRCAECISWSEDFMHVFLKHRQTLVAKGKKKPGVAGPPLPSSAPALTVAPVSIASISQDVALDRELVPPSVQLGVTSSFSAPSSVPHSVATVVGPTVGERLEIPIEGLATVPSGMAQESHGLPPVCVHDAISSLGSLSFSSMPSSSLPPSDIDRVISGVRDQYGVRGGPSTPPFSSSVSLPSPFLSSASSSLFSARSPSQFLFPFSDSGLPPSVPSSPLPASSSASSSSSASLSAPPGFLPLPSAPLSASSSLSAGFLPPRLPFSARSVSLFPPASSVLPVYSLARPLSLPSSFSWSSPAVPAVPSFSDLPSARLPLGSIPSAPFPFASSASSLAFPTPPPGFPPCPPSVSFVSSSASSSAPFASCPSVASPLSALPSLASARPVVSLLPSGLSSAAFPSSASSVPPRLPSGFSSSASSSSPSSSSPRDLASFTARSLGLSAEYLDVVRWFVHVGGSDLRGCVLASFPHLSSDLDLDFRSGSSHLLAAFSHSSSSSPVVSSSLPHRSVSSSLASSSFLPSTSSSLASFPSSFPAWGSRVSAAPAAAPVVGHSAASLAVPVAAYAGPVFRADPVHFPDPSASSSFAWPSDAAEEGEELDEEDLDPSYPPAPDVVSIPPRTPDSFSKSYREMMRFIISVFPQAAGSPSVPPPPSAVFEDIFPGSSAPDVPLFFDWFGRVRTALQDTDARLASVFANNRSLLSLLPHRSSTYAVHGDFAGVGALPPNPQLSAMFDRPIKPQLQLGISVRDSVAMGGSLRSAVETMSHSMWVLSGLIAYIRQHGFVPPDPSLFNTMVTALSRGLANQASSLGSLTSFLEVRRREFYLSHLPAYFLESNKRSMLAAPVWQASQLFPESDVQSLLSLTQTSSQLRSQQALVDVASRGSGFRSRRPARSSPARPSPRRRRRDSASPSSSPKSKRVRFDSPAPSSALKKKRDFRR